jgi:hypothetical protein
MNTGNTVPIIVSNVSFLLDRLSQDCTPNQFVREFQQNSMEAIQRAQEKGLTENGEIIWDYETEWFNANQVYKLCITDNGDGMTGEEMKQYINSLSSSIHEQSLEGNYGIGAKISAIPSNQYGVVYQSWKDGNGQMIQSWKDPDGTYGLKRFEIVDENDNVVQYSPYKDLNDSHKPAIIDKNGTRVIFLGNHYDSNTMIGPDNQKGKWLCKELNSRFFTLPKNITTKVRLDWHSSVGGKLNVIRGQKELLERDKVSSGTKVFSNFTAHWWLLKEEARDGSYQGGGHVAVLYNNELYDRKISKAGSFMLQRFGILFGQGRVVIYIEPHKDNSNKLLTNSARTNITINNQSVPWEDWAHEFSADLPDELEAYIEEKASKSKSNSQSIWERLKDFIEFYKFSHYKPTKINPDSTCGEPNGSAHSGNFDNPGDNLGERRKPKRPDPVNDVYGNGTIQKSKETTGNPFPKTYWISVEENTRDANELVDRAARYVSTNNTLVINYDFKSFQDEINYWCTKYNVDDTSIQKGIIIKSVKSWFEQSLIETVLGIKVFENSKNWDEDKIEAALSEEALTAVAVQRYHVNTKVGREMGSNLGAVPKE